MDTYRYLCPERPPMPGGIPKGAVSVDYTEFTYEDTGGGTHHIWGAVEYDRELTDKEIQDYELIPDE